MRVIFVKNKKIKIKFIVGHALCNMYKNRFA